MQSLAGCDTVSLVVDLQYVLNQLQQKFVRMAHLHLNLCIAHKEQRHAAHSNLARYCLCWQDCQQASPKVRIIKQASALLVCSMKINGLAMCKV